MKKIDIILVTFLISLTGSFSNANVFKPVKRVMCKNQQIQILTKEQFILSPDKNIIGHSFLGKDNCEQSDFYLYLSLTTGSVTQPFQQKIVGGEITYHLGSKSSCLGPNIVRTPFGEKYTRFIYSITKSGEELAIYGSPRCLNDALKITF